MGSGAMLYVPNFIKIGWGIQKLIGVGAHRQQRDLISLLLLFQNKEIRIKSVVTTTTTTPTVTTIMACAVQEATISRGWVEGTPELPTPAVCG
jgi:hypothetical protein